MLFYSCPDNHYTIGSYMSAILSPVEADLRLGAEYRRKQAIKELRRLESTLIRSEADGQLLADVCARVRVAGRPKGPGGKNRAIREVIDRRGLTFLFRADDAEEFAGRRGKLHRKKMRRSAESFSFENPVTVTKVTELGKTRFSVMDGKGSFLIEFSDPKDPSSDLVIVRRGTFKQPTGRSALSGRFSGRGPSGSSE